MEFLPIFGEVGVHTVLNGPIAHTPDDNPLVGPQAGLTNFWNLHGFSVGIAQGGIGKYMAQWMVHGQTEINMAPLDSRRFGEWADQEYCTIKAIEAYENMYTPFAPNDNRPHARPARHSPLYALLNQKGAVHGVVNGYEKPWWFTTNDVREESLSWAHTEAHEIVAAECMAIQNQAGIIDLCGSAKYQVKGPDATAFLDYLSANKLPSKDGRMGLTLMHAENGGIMNEMSVTRINSEFYYLNSAILSDLKDYDWLSQHMGEFDVSVTNVSESIGAMLVTGPESRAILQELTQDDLSNNGLKWLGAKTVMLDAADVLIMRVSYAGELGFELHMPTYQITSIYESLMRVGEDKGLRDFGGYAFNSLRMEKAYRAYNHEFTEEFDGIDAGMDRFIDLTRNFLGAESIRNNRQDKNRMRLAYLVFRDDIPCECFGNESVFHDGKHIGLTTGGAFGHRVGKSLAFAYVAPDYAVAGTQLQIETTLGMRLASVEQDCAYDPQNERMRG
jgi:dimethylglycine dehydrogenase